MTDLQDRRDVRRFVVAQPTATRTTPATKLGVSPTPRQQESAPFVTAAPPPPLPQVVARIVEAMPFSYYARLSPRDRAIYRESDAVASVALPRAETLYPLVDELRHALAREDRGGVEAAAKRLAQGMTRLLGLPPVALSVLAVRPSSSWGELHGLYTREPGRTPRIQ